MIRAVFLKPSCTLSRYMVTSLFSSTFVSRLAKTAFTSSCTLCWIDWVGAPEETATKKKPRRLRGTLRWARGQQLRASAHATRCELCECYTWDVRVKGARNIDCATWNMHKPYAYMAKHLFSPNFYIFTSAHKYVRIFHYAHTPTVTLSQRRGIAARRQQHLSREVYSMTELVLTVLTDCADWQYRQYWQYWQHQDSTDTTVQYWHYWQHQDSTDSTKTVLTKTKTVLTVPRQTWPRARQ